MLLCSFSKEIGIMKIFLFLSFISSLIFTLKAQPSNCTFKEPAVTIDFGTGEVADVNTMEDYNYQKVRSTCPADGHYTYSQYTNDCFNGDWFTLEKDHTGGAANGNMMLVNASPASGVFLTTKIDGLKSETTYEFAAWMMNLCKPSDKCPYPLLPNITILLLTPTGKKVAQFGTGELIRRQAPRWTRYQAIFTTPPSNTALTLIMIDNNPGGCGNDFALDDITFRECVTPIPVAAEVAKSAAIPKPKRALPELARKRTVTTPVKRTVIPSLKRMPEVIQTAKPQTERTPQITAVLKPVKPVFPSPPSILTNRTTPLVKQIETEAGEINVDVYDNGDIDGDTVSIYHNNELIASHARLSEKPISFHIAVDAAHPHHELVMVAHNLGSIPPNTSLMVVTTRTRRYEVFISSNEQKNAKVVLDLKE